MAVPRQRGFRAGKPGCRFLRMLCPSPLRLYASLLLLSLNALAATPPLRLHPENPRWFEWRGRAIALITSAEHYGSALNLDFDFRRYLATLERDGMNYTRVFAGTYVEPQGAFGIQRNTLAPRPQRFLAPWARSDQAGYAGGGNRFDLDRFDPDYLARLKEVLAEAGRRGVVVELTLFCSTYGEAQWAVHPLNASNNLQSLAIPDWRTLNTSASPPPMRLVQDRFVRWLVRELNDFDNLFFEIQNEPWADNHTLGDFINPYLTANYQWPNAVEVTAPDSVAWQRAIARIIVDEERGLPNRHLIAQNVANFRLAAGEADLVPEASILNFHYAYPEVVDWNRGAGRVIGYDETGFAGNADATYLKQAWNFVLSGGALFNNLDYSFSVGQEDGSGAGAQAPGGGTPVLRRQLQVLSRFLHQLPLEKLNPTPDVVAHAPGVVVRVLGSPGRCYALYAEGRGPTTLVLKPGRGAWEAVWISVEDGLVLRQESVVARRGVVQVASPGFAGGVALSLVRK